MMEKVLLTSAQAAVIDHFRKNGKSNAEILDNHFYKHWDSEKYTTLSDDQISTDKLVAALYVGYEIEPEEPKFKPEDKVIFVNGIPKIYELDYLTTGGWRCVTGEWINPDAIRLATPEEIYWLGTLKRDKVPDFREGDVYVDAGGRVFTLGESNSTVRVSFDRAKSWYADDGDFKGIYPVQSFAPFPQEESK